ncbi:LpqB family beta-propeller domain-containing protein [Peterkaempfera bronchialis]|uniref:S9 family peptidase n=1 Tax=Peterkaempfera bronchialis TaxID=2126346 RepID=A0A345T224_9ACTN|nr:LpqB family beta-propeller domain-containing protein [Peterkaempfera bronchialis]AXI80029.1 S9 family peptidase [Peterkaempfera bronchialis]
MTTTAPYGTWTSPITAQHAAAHGGRPDWVRTVGDEVWWTEPRPAEDGRATLVRRRADGTTETLLPAPWNLRSRVIEYGGMPWTALPATAGRGPVAVFSHFADQRLYRHEPDTPGAAPQPLTPAPDRPAGLRYADPVIAPGGAEVWCVRESFHGPGPTDLRRSLVAVPLDGSAADDPSAVRELLADRHFVTGPRISPDGRRAAWIGWEHPAMPWDGTELRIADLAPDGTLTRPRTVAGGPDEAVCQAEWLDDRTLVAATDPGGWWNLYRIDTETGEAVALLPAEEEYGGPLWRIGQRWFAVLPDGRIAVTHGRSSWRLGVLDPADGTLTDVPGPWTEWAATLDAHDGRITAVAAGPDRGWEVVGIDPDDLTATVIGHPHTETVDPRHLPAPQARTFTGPGGREVHAHLYPPRNPDHTAPPGELPPYVVFAHGGPTSRTPMVLDLEIGYFTSRGIGVVAVDYGGSTGHGRDYRNRLRGQWGVVDVEDCAAAARALVAEGLADPRRLAIRGGSAGGWTTAASLTAIPGLYRCGAIYYPVLDLTGWSNAGETHDFESRYLDTLVGPLPEAADRYRDRSPLTHADRLTAPFLLLQGLDDVICPPSQAERLLDRIAGRGVPHSYLTFPGEGHGFRRADSVTTALEAELALYAHAFALRRDDLTPLDLHS